MGGVLALLAFALQTPSLTLPAFTAYLEPNSHGAVLQDGGEIGNWSDPRTQIEWGGYFAKTGPVHVYASVDLPAMVTGNYQIKVGGTVLSCTASGAAEADFGTFQVTKPGWQTFWLKGVSRTGTSFGFLKYLRLEGDAVADAKFNLKTRRNAASVHLMYPAPEGTEWFYNEVTGVEDPLATYYMACGFSRGYFGMQVNGPKERRVIFSIWDSGKEAVDRSKVGASDRVQLIAKGTDVFAGGFGNEGTGGHSHLVFPWKTGAMEKFLVHAEPKGDTTFYSAFFKSPSDKDWRLIASFSAPHDGKYLHGLYSFVEDFDGENGNVKRKALYGPAWVKTATGDWQPILQAKFSHDGTGGKDRFDYDFGIERGRFYLQNGGFEGSSPKYGTVAKLAVAPSQPPVVDLAEVERLVSSSAGK